MDNLIRALIPFFHITVMSALPIGFAIGSGMQKIDIFSIDRTEVSVGEFRQFVKDTGLVTKAERAGGGLVFGKGWERKAGWNWSSPFGSPAGKGGLYRNKGKSTGALHQWYYLYIPDRPVTFWRKLFK